MNIAKNNFTEKSIFILLMIGTLLFPLYNYFHIYFAFNLILLALIVVRYKFEYTILTKIVLLLTILFILGRLFSWLDTSSLYTRDFFELARFLLLFLVLGLINFFRKIDLKFILLVLSIYVISDFFVSLLQVTNIDYNNIVFSISELYSSPHHLNGAFNGYRAIGLSSGPGQHGEIIVFMYILFFMSYLLAKEKLNSYIYLAVSFVSLLSLVLAQSKTAMLSVAITNIFILFYFIYIKNKSIIKRVVLAYFLMIFSVVLILVIFKDEFANTLNLLEHGVNISSYEARLNAYKNILMMASENLQYILLGYGKVYFGHYAGTMDSDLLYFSTVYGLLFVLILFYFLVEFMINSVKEKGALLDKPFNVILIFIIIVGVIMSYPSSFFVHPLNLILFGILLVKVKNENTSSF